MNRFLNHIYNYLVLDFRHLDRGILFSKLLYAFVALKSCYWLYNFDSQFLNILHINSSIPSISVVKDYAFVLSHVCNSKINLLAILFVLISSFCLIFIKRNFLWLRILVWLAIINIHNFVYVGLSGGDYLLNQLLFFNCFIIINKNTNIFKLNDLRIILHNLSIIGCIVLICLVYFTSGLTKILQENWQNGTAINFVINTRHYSLPWLYKAKLSGWVNYLVIFFQLTFFLGMCFKQSRTCYLLGGMFFHLIIFLVMGLFNFSILMLIPYVLFFDLKLPHLNVNKKAGKKLPA